MTSNSRQSPSRQHSAATCQGYSESLNCPLSTDSECRFSAPMLWNTESKLFTIVSTTALTENIRFTVKPFIRQQSQTKNAVKNNTTFTQWVYTLYKNTGLTWHKAINEGHKACVRLLYCFMNKTAQILAAPCGLTIASHSLKIKKTTTGNRKVIIPGCSSKRTGQACFFFFFKYLDYFVLQILPHCALTCNVSN